MPECHGEVPEETSGTSSNRLQGRINARSRYGTRSKRTVASGLEALARLLGRAAAAEATASIAAGITPDLDTK